MDDKCIECLEIGDHITISYGAYFACHGKGQSHHRIVIKNGAYIGMRCTIIATKEDTVIGTSAIVGAGTLVNKSIPDGATAVGVPCRILDK